MTVDERLERIEETLSQFGRAITVLAESIDALSEARVEQDPRALSLEAQHQHFKRRDS